LLIILHVAKTMIFI